MELFGGSASARLLAFFTVLATGTLAGACDRAGGGAGAAGASAAGAPTPPTLESAKASEPASAGTVAAPSGAPTPQPLSTSSPSTSPTPIHLAFAGDIALNYSIAEDLEAVAAGKAPKGAEPGFPFAGVAERLRAADLAMANLECVASTQGKASTWHKPFRAPVSGIGAILASGIDVVTVANNHSWDFGEEGFTDMLKNLDRENLAAVGRSYKQELPHGREQPLVREVRGTRLGFLGFYLADDADLVRDVTAASKQADVVVVYFHWGREKQSDVTPEQRRQARAAIDAGAGLVVGSHVHVLQPAEMYKGKLIAYGLGNFVFMGMNHEERFRRGAILEVAITRDGVSSFELVPTRVDDRGAPRLVIAENSYLPGESAK